MDFRMDMDEETLMATFEELLEMPDETDRRRHGPSARAYYRDRKAMARTPTDIKELPGKLVFVMDMPGVKPGEIKVRVEDGNMLCVNAERRREKEEAEEEDKENQQQQGQAAAAGKYLRVERRMGKFMRKFPLPDDANKDGIGAVYENGVLTVTVERLPPPEPKQPKNIEVKVA